MNKKGQDSLSYMGVIIGIFVTIIVVLALFQSSAQNMSAAVNTLVLDNKSYTAPASEVTIDLLGQELLSTPVVINGTSEAAVPTTNYTIAEGISTTTGLKVIQYTSHAIGYAGEPVNITYTYGADGYIEDSGARSVAGIILIFAALAVAIVALVPTLRNSLIDSVKGI
jgi:hypothetical protein